MSQPPLQELLQDELLDIHYQPIVDLRTGKIFAYEALSRPGSAFGTPQNLIQAAVEAGEIGRLGRLQREIAVSGAVNWPIFLNIEPTEFDHGWLVRPDDPIFRHNRPVYLEITETVPLKFFEHCHSVLAEVRKKGARLAIDDLGAGFSNLKYISELEPDIVKFDRELIMGCRPGSRELGLLVSLTELCHELHAEVVAEGIETLDELDAVLEAAADYGQGNLFAPPASGLRGIYREDGLSPDLLRERIERGRAVRAARVAAVPPAPKIEPEPEGEPAPEPVVDAGVKEDTQELRVRLRKTARDLAESLRHRDALEGRLEAAASLSQRHQEEEGRGRSPVGSERRGRSIAPIAVTAVFCLIFGAVLMALLGPRATPPAETAAATAAAVSEPDASSGPAALSPADNRRPSLTESPPAEPSDPGASSADGVVEGPVSQQAQPPSRPGSTPPPTALSRGELLAVVAQIEGWAEAWSAQRPERYLSFYSRDFRAEGDLSASQWRATRRERIRSPDWIRVALGPLEVVGLPSGGARATFEQSYESDSFSDRVLKTLELAREDGTWRIVAESSEPL